MVIIIINFGKKPEKGGKPANDSNARVINRAIIGVLLL